MNETLQTFSLSDLTQYTKEKAVASNASSDFRLMSVGRDDVHSAIKHVLSRVSVSLHLSMFGYDDEELNDIVMRIAHDPSIACFIALDKSQSGGVHEKKLLASDAANDPAAFNTHFAIGESATHQILHIKGGTADGRVGFEGSTNWSESGEGIFVPSGDGAAGGAGYKAQANTQTFFTCPYALARFTAQMNLEFAVIQSRGK